MLFFILLLFASPNATSGECDEGWCSGSYRLEAYAVGLARGFTGNSNLASDVHILDQICLRMGVREGQTLISGLTTETARCREAFDQAAEAALRASPPTSTEPQECVDAGQLYGASLLAIYARSRQYSKVGRACTEAYSQGRADILADRPRQQQTTELANRCYETGYDDGMLFEGLL